MANEEESYLRAVAAWNAAHATAGLSMTVLNFMNMNGHGVAWCQTVRLDVPDNPESNRSFVHCLICEHHLLSDDFDPFGYPRPQCPVHKSACLQRQIELHAELSQAADVVNAADFYNSPLTSRALILIAVLQRLANNEFVGVPGHSLESADVQRLCFGDEVDNFSLDDLLAIVSTNLYQVQGARVSCRTYGNITKIARIGNPALNEGDQ